MTVEVDESHLFWRKYGVGRKVKWEDQCLLGCYCREVVTVGREAMQEFYLGATHTGACFGIPAPRRDTCMLIFMH